jgi:hypothetical protein
VGTEPNKTGETVMLTFCGSDLALTVEQLLDKEDWPTLCCARDAAGGRWLIVQVDDNPVHLAWMCAPLSERAMRAIRDGRCAPLDVLCHSATGTVELITLDLGRVVPDRCVVGGQVSELLWTSATKRSRGRQGTRP